MECSVLRLWSGRPDLVRTLVLAQLGEALEPLLHLGVREVSHRGLAGRLQCQAANCVHSPLAQAAHQLACPRNHLRQLYPWLDFLPFDGDAN